jgi:alcohol dehydrogenase (cytochrome c)
MKAYPLSLRLAAAAVLSLAVSSLGLAAGPTQHQLDAARQNGSNWLMYNRTYSGDRFSPLTQINTTDASQLTPVCANQLGTLAAFQATPVEYRGVLYVTTQHQTVAMNAATCKTLWDYTYVPTGPEPINTNRGVALYKGMVIRGTDDAHLIALNAGTGKLIWNVKVGNSAIGEFLSAAPIVWKNLIFIGLAGADWGIKGQVYAYNVKNGKRVWTFNDIPTGNAVGASTWGRAASTATGGGSTWSTITLDRSNGLVYVPIGNPAPDFAPEYRPGANLFTDSVVELNAKTGKLVRWHQQVPNDSHDWDTAAAPILFTTSNGHHYMAVADKAGYLFVYNQATHKLAYKVPTTTIHNASLHPTVKGVYTCPADLGGTEWSSPAYDPQTAALYVNSVDWCGVDKLGEVRYVAGQLFFGGSSILDPVAKASGWLDAFDASSGQTLWRWHSPTPMLAGVTPTAGGVLMTGDLNGNFLVFDARTGQKLYQFDTGGAMAGGVITYKVNGRQYVAVASGNSSRSIWGTTGSGTIFVFALPY